MINIDEHLVEELRKQTVFRSKDLICGAVLGLYNGEDREIRIFLKLENEIAENRITRFLISPDQYIRTENYAAAQGLELLGFYYASDTLPQNPADLNLNYALPGFMYLCVNLNDGDIRISAWSLNENRTKFISEETEINKTEFYKFRELAEAI